MSGRNGAAIAVGQHVWLPCEVKPGPFPDERMVRVNSPVVRSAASSWIGFVPATKLREPIDKGSTEVSAIIVKILDDRFFAQLLGDSFSNSLFEDHISRAQPIDPVES